jgi:cation:H+ antiporter
MFLYIIFIIIGFILLIKGADFLVDGASGIARKFKIPTIIIGLTIVAIGTSMPELMVSTTASIEGHSDISIGNVVGSNIANLFFILGICSIIKSLEFHKETEKFENFVVLFATILLAFFGNNNKENQITRIEGIIFLIFSVLFILYNIFMAKRKKENTIVELDNTEKEEIPILKAIFGIIIGISALKIGGDVVVKYASLIAKEVGLSEKIISVTIIAFSTSLPELITSITATIRGETDMAIGNILGSQIFNIFLIIGVSSLLCPINYSLEYNIDMLFLIVGTAIFAIFPFTGKKHYMTRVNGIIFVIIYIVYLITSIIRVC